jgi:ATP-dependent DNA helicase RecG
VDWDDDDELRALIHRLCDLDTENEWVEFKENNDDPDGIGEYISCLANAAALAGKDAGFLVYGVRDDDHAIVGTSIDPSCKKVGNEDLGPWLVRLLSPQVNFAWSSVEMDEGRVVVLRVDCATSTPVKFKGQEYIRVGSYKKPLKDHPEHARRLWKALESYSFEEGTAAGDLSVEQVVQLIDYPAFFTLLGQPLPENRSAIIEALEEAGVVRHDVENQWQITNVGALLYAADLSKFPRLSRKAVRVIQYDGTSRVITKREQEGQRGYASGFKGLIGYITDLLPNSEVIIDGLRMDDLLFPKLAIRELVANALIHQDLTMTGTGPMIEIFDDRMEITNPGVPLLDPLRFIDGAPRSRNERLARAMRLHRICEERGSGWDKVAFEVEFHQLPPPLIEVHGEQTRVTLFAPKPLGSMDRPERVRAMYQHACLSYVSGQPTTNTSVRKRFAIAKKNSAQASKIIREAIEEEMIVPYDPSAGPRSIRYVPFWAAPDR